MINTNAVLLFLNVISKQLISVHFYSTICLHYMNLSAFFSLISKMTSECFDFRFAPSLLTPSISG